MTNDRLAEIFNRQAQFVESLHPIHLANDMWAGPYPLLLDSRRDQEHFRLLAWRCTEELIEAVECHYECVDMETYDGKFKEEMADALHFLIELCLAMGITEGELVSGYEDTILNPGVDQLGYCFWQCGKAAEGTIPERIGNVGYKLGLAMHQLRQRPWRTDNRPTNRTLLVGKMHATWFTFVTACKRAGVNSNELYDAYFKKGVVNDQRTAQQHLNENAPYVRCSKCGRKSYDVISDAVQCGMTQPYGSVCDGILQ